MKRGCGAREPRPREVGERTAMDSRALRLPLGSSPPPPRPRRRSARRSGVARSRPANTAPTPSAGGWRGWRAWAGARVKGERGAAAAAAASIALQRFGFGKGSGSPRTARAPRCRPPPGHSCAPAWVRVRLRAGLRVRARLQFGLGLGPGLGSGLGSWLGLWCE
eukprot:scaffold54372_cov48-Phaeocystis_antarctica.AAC.2